MWVSYLVFFFIPALLFAQPKVEVVWEVPLSFTPSEITVYHDPGGDRAKDRIIVSSRKQVEVFDLTGKRVYRFPKAHLYAVSKQGKFIVQHRDYRDLFLTVYDVFGKQFAKVECLKELFPFEIAVSDGGTMAIYGSKNTCTDRCPHYTQLFDFSGGKIWDSNEEERGWVEFSYTGDYFLVLTQDKENRMDSLYGFSKDMTLMWKKQTAKRWQDYIMIDLGAVDELSKTMLYRQVDPTMLFLVDVSGAILQKVEARNLIIRSVQGHVYAIMDNAFFSVGKDRKLEKLFVLKESLPANGYWVGAISIHPSWIVLSTKVSPFYGDTELWFISRTKGQPVLKEKGFVLDIAYLDYVRVVVLFKDSIKVYQYVGNKH